MSSQARFLLADSGVAKLDEAGRVLAIADGKTVLTAEIGEDREGNHPHCRIEPGNTRQLRQARGRHPDETGM